MIIDAFFFFVHVVKSARFTLWLMRKVNREVNPKTMNASFFCGMLSTFPTYYLLGYDELVVFAV